MELVADEFVLADGLFPGIEVSDNSFGALVSRLGAFHLDMLHLAANQRGYAGSLLLEQA